MPSSDIADDYDDDVQEYCCVWRQPVSLLTFLLQNNPFTYWRVLYPELKASVFQGEIRACLGYEVTPHDG